MITVNPVESLLQLSAGYYVSRALHTVADLGVADALGDTPQTAEAIAAATGADANALERVVRLLALYGIFEYRNGVLQHTPMSRMLRDDHPQSMRPLVRMFGSPGLWAAVGELGWTIRTGEPSADRALPVAKQIHQHQPGGIAQQPEAVSYRAGILGWQRVRQRHLRHRSAYATI